MRVFISHSRHDRAWYSSLCSALDGAQISRWDDGAIRGGEPLADELRRAIDACDACIFLATEQSLESRWCLAELGAFWGAGKKVVVLADPDIPDDNFPPQFRGNKRTSDTRHAIESIRQAHAGVRTTKKGLRADLGSMTLRVTMGRIEDVAAENSDYLVALPANEFFDDDCIQDAKSALGAFMQHHFPDRIAEIQDLVKGCLSDQSTTEVEKTPGELGQSYGVGRAVFLDRPLETPWRIAMVAVTTQRADEGLRATASAIFKAAAELVRLMANNRINRLLVPVLGSGHGVLKHKLSLMSMLMAFCELHLRRAGRHVKEVNIVVFRKDPSSDPSIPEGVVRRTLAFARDLME